MNFEILKKTKKTLDKLVCLWYNNKVVRTDDALKNGAGVAQLVEQLICNQQVGGSSPSTSSNMGEFPSGQRGQTVNLLRFASMVRIRPLPPKTPSANAEGVFLYSIFFQTPNTVTKVPVFFFVIFPRIPAYNASTLQFGG